MSKPHLRVVKNESTNSAQIFLYGIIGDYWYSDDPLTARRFQQQLNNLFDVNEIHVHINSPGGDVMEGLGISNAIQSSKKIIHTHNDGVCASMGAVILASAKKGHRHAAKGSLTMFHSASTFAWGNATQLREDADMLEKHDEVLAEIIADALGRPMADVKATYFDGKDHWLTATELESEGFLTIDNYDASDVPDNASAMKYEKVAAFYRGTTPTPQINNENMFGKDKFKSLSALAKVAAAEITAEQVEAVNNEIETEGIPGVTLVLDSQLQTLTDDAGKVPGLNTKVTDLETAAKTAQTTIENLTKEVADLKKAGGKPAAEADGVKPDSTDKTPKDDQEKEVDDETPTDLEYKQINAVRNLIP